MPKTIDTTECHRLANDSDDAKPILLDVRLEDDYQAGHIPGAVNNCVFEVDFLKRLKDQAPDQSKPICVYGNAAESAESEVAAEKLERAGYQDVIEFTGGFDAWQHEGHPVEAGKNATPPEPRTIADGEHPIDLEECRVEWMGRNLLSKHWGAIGLKSGSLKIAGGLLNGGRFVLDMNDLHCANLKGDDLHDVLINHLKSDDFFDTGRYPEASFEITRARPLDGAAPGSRNLHILGELTLKNVTAPIDFAASAGITKDGKAAAQAAFSIDRTRWNVIYGSGKFFKRLADHLVNDHIDLQFKVVTK